MKNKLVKQAETKLPTRFGDFQMISYSEEVGNPMPHLAMVSDNSDFSKPVLVRIHSECMTGDVFGSLRCDCGEQLDQSMEMTGRDGGVVIYLRQEGRGIGLINKMKAYNLQDKGLNTAEANIHLGFEIDERDYSIAIQILRDLGIKSILLMTNNPEKLESLKNSGVEVLGRVPVEVKPHRQNIDYLQTKQNLMGHLLDIS
mgnify:CR=1 FL=1